MKARRYRRFFHAEEIRRPQDVIKHLAKGQQHWRKGYSAFELAHCWIASGGIPVRVRAALDDCPPYHAAELIEGFFERQINLRTRGYPSQTDLMAYLRLKDGYAVAAVEGKVDEPFGDLVAEWNDGSSGRVRRPAGKETRDITAQSRRHKGPAVRRQGSATINLHDR